MLNTILINTICEALTEYSIFKDKLSKSDKDAIIYIVGQTIRQYNISNEHTHISKDANEMWHKLTSDDINKYEFSKYFTCDNIPTDGHVVCMRYKGASKVSEPLTIRHNQRVRFNDVFHKEHTIPVVLIRHELFNLKPNEITYDNVKNILDTMHVCRILKTEDRLMPLTKGRTLSFEDNIKNIYNKYGIELLN